MMVNRNKQILRMVEMALLIALIFVLQMFGSFIKIGPLPMSFVLVPIVIGACMLGTKEGAILGGVFGVITMVLGIMGADPVSNILFNANPFWFVFLCLFKAIMAGFCSGLVYKGLGKLFGGKHIYLKTVIASISAPIVNTGIFVVGMLIFFFNTAAGLPAIFPEGLGAFESAFSVIFFGLAGFNFVGEFLVNLILSPAIVRIIDAVRK